MEEWWIDGILPQGKLCAIWGDSESGKSAVMVDVCASVRHGLPDWLGHGITPGDAVLYIPNEDGQGEYVKRFKGWMAAHSVSCLSHVHIADEGVQLLNTASVNECIALVRQMNPRPALIVLDTYSKAIVDGMRSDKGDGDRNETNRALDAAERIRAAGGLTPRLCS